VDLISEEIAKGAAENGWTDETIYLNDYVIKPCQSCGVRDEDDICIFHDDIYPVYEKFSNCDAVIAASPIYFDSVSAQLKLLIDRCNCYRPLKKSHDEEPFIEKKLWKVRKGIIVLVGGERQKHQQALSVIKGFFIWTGVEFLDSIYYAHNSWETGTAIDDSEILNKAFELGMGLPDSSALSD
jgi:multimeric flavodoxin WrbA